MDPKVPNIWRRPWTGARGMLAWFGVLVAATFAIVFYVGLITGLSDAPNLVKSASVISVLSTLLVLIALPFFRWFFRWQILRRVLFVLACLVTLAVLALTEENWRGRIAWQNHRRGLEAQGEKFSLQALSPPQVADEKNFALTPLLKPLFDFTYGTSGLVWGDTNGRAHIGGISAELSPLPQLHTTNHLVTGNLEKGTFAELASCAAFYRGNTNYPQAGTSAGPAEGIMLALGKFDPELKELREAAATRPYSRFPFSYDHQPPHDILLPHLAPIKALTLIVNLRATAELEEGRPTDAFDDLKLGLRFSDAIHEEPLLIDHLVRLATLGLDLQTLREGLARHAWTEGQLAELQGRLGEIDLLAEYKSAMRGERVLGTAGLDYMRRQGFGAKQMYYQEVTGAAKSTVALNPLLGGFYYQNMLTISRMYQQFTLRAVDERAHRVFPEVNESGQFAIDHIRRGPYSIFAEMLLPAVQHAVLRSARMQTFLDAARVACGLERYRLANGKLPEKLDVLAPLFINSIPNDVIDGKPLRYRLDTKAGYILYSVGWNRTDDGGKLAWTKERKNARIEPTKGDWVWQMPGRLPTDKPVEQATLWPESRPP